MANGFLLALEGIDGSGTTTQAARVARWLGERGVLVHATAEPSKGPIGLLLRQALAQNPKLDEASLALLFAADRLNHLEREILPALAKGQVVITDRYLLSSLAYQSSKLPLAWVQRINERAQMPDASVLLRVRPEIAAERRTQRGGDTEHFDDLDRQQQVALAYDGVFALPDVGPTYEVDADPGLEEVSRALDALLEHILARFLR